MKRLLIVLFALLPAMALADATATLRELSAYINGIDTARARFTQYNSDGSRSGGTLTIDRPGKARFEYDPPNQDTLVVVGGGQVGVFDGRGKPEQYPLSRTPLKLILGNRVDLTRASMVTGLGENAQQVIVEARDPQHPEYGTIRMTFLRSPLRLTEWTVTSESGEKTRTVLGPFQNPGRLSLTLFDINSEMRRRQ